MTIVQFANQFANEIGEIVAMIYEWKQRRILVPLGLPIDAVHGGRVEEIAHLPPGLKIDLAPLGMVIELHVETFQFELVVLPSLLVLRLDFVFRQIDDGVVLLDFDQHLFAIIGNLISVHVAQNGLFPIFQAVGAEM